MPFEVNQQGFLECDDDGLWGRKCDSSWEDGAGAGSGEGEDEQCTVTGTRGEDDVSCEKPQAPAPPLHPTCPHCLCSPSYSLHH